MAGTRTIRLKVGDQVYEKLMWLLSKFGKDELEVLPEDTQFEQDKKYLQAELQSVREGTATYLTIEELEEKLEQTIRKNENRIS
jgi:hypothetical protein